MIEPVKNAQPTLPPSRMEGFNDDPNGGLLGPPARQKRSWAWNSPSATFSDHDEFSVFVAFKKAEWNSSQEVVLLGSDVKALAVNHKVVSGGAVSGSPERLMPVQFCVKPGYQYGSD